MQDRVILKRILLLFSSLVVIGTVGYMLLMKLPFIDALYMTAITISTVGYKEVLPLSEPAKLFTIFIIFWALGVVGYTFSTIVVFIVEGRVKQLWRGMIMKNKLQKLNDHYLICGGGEVSHIIVERLKQEGCDYLIIEEDIDSVRELMDDDYMVMQGTPTNEESLMEANIMNARGLVTILPDDVDNIVTVLTARGLRPDLYIASLANDQGSVEKLKKVGANNSISSNEIGGRRLATLLTHPNIISFLDVLTRVGDVDFNLEDIEVLADSELADKMLKEARIPDKTGLIVLAIRKSESSIIFNPKSSEKMEIGDHLLVLGTAEQQEKLRYLARPK